MEGQILSTYAPSLDSFLGNVLPGDSRVPGAFSKMEKQEESNPDSDWGGPISDFQIAQSTDLLYT